jgi:hypothetical protein
MVESGKLAPELALQVQLRFDEVRSVRPWTLTDRQVRNCNERLNVLTLRAWSLF